jgi:glutaconate CoA-transferase subunit B
LLVVGIPLAAMGLAQQMRAPNLTILYGGIVVNPRLDGIPTLYPSGMDRRHVRATARLDPNYAFALARRGEIDIGFATAAQVDRYDNVNSTCLGPHAQPHVRSVGSGCLPEPFSSWLNVSMSLRTPGISTAPTPETRWV